MVALDLFGVVGESGWYVSADTRGFNVRALDGTLVP